MTMNTKHPKRKFVSTKRIVAVIDLAGFTKAFQSRGDVKMAAFVHDYYTACKKAASAKGGTIVKFMGDACLITFPPRNAKQAVETTLNLQGTIEVLAKRNRLMLAVGANLHLADVIELGKDIIGRGVNQTFLLGHGPGIRISEPFYRALPGAMRSSWTKHTPPAVYHLGSTEGIYEGLGKSPDANAARW